MYHDPVQVQLLKRQHKATELLEEVQSELDKVSSTMCT